MTMIHYFVGDLEDPKFDYEGGNWNGNMPPRISPYIPLSGMLFQQARNKVRSNEWEGKQTDWGSYVIRLYPNQLETYLKECLKHDTKFVDSIIHKLDVEKQYALVASEAV